MTRLTTLVLCLLCLSLVSYAQDTNGTLQVDNLERSYYLQTPANMDSQTAHPLLIVLHGSGSNGAMSMTSTRFANYIESNELLVAYPNGYRLHWFPVDADEYAPDADVANDVLFIQMLIDELDTLYHVDRERIYVTGYSSGGFMAVRLMCELPLAGIAIVSATTTPEIAQHCLDTEKATNTLAILGTQDQVVSPNGSAYVENGALNVWFSFLQFTGFITTLFNCGIDKELIRIDADDSPNQVIRESRNNCADDARFDLVLVAGQDHAYPVAPRFVLSDLSVGNVDQLILDFFGLSFEE